MTRVETALAEEAEELNQEGGAMHEAVPPTEADAVSQMSIRDQYRNHIPTQDLTVLLNAALDASGCLINDRQYARALAAMEATALDER
jgi:hypothetical protein